MLAGAIPIPACTTCGRSAYGRLWPACIRNQGPELPRTNTEAPRQCCVPRSEVWQQPGAGPVRIIIAHRDALWAATQPSPMHRCRRDAQGPRTNQTALMRAKCRGNNLLLSPICQRQAEAAYAAFIGCNCPRPNRWQHMGPWDQDTQVQMVFNPTGRKCSISNAAVQNFHMLDAPSIP